MGNHRADVVPTSRPSDQVTPYAGRRRALPLDESVVEAPPAAPYAGRRRATAVESPVAALQPVPTTTELHAIFERTLDETAPRPRVIAPLMVAPADTLPRLDVPLPAPRLEAEVDPAVTRAPLFVDDTLFLDDSRADIPAVARPADLSDEQTVTIPLTPAVGPNGRRRAPAARTARRGKLPSLPVLAGVASIAAVVAGVATTGHAVLAPAASTHLVQASAFGGFSGSGSVGSGAHQSLSRGGTDRNDIASLMKQRDDALQASNRSANAYDDQLAKNLWVLPIQAGGYHLTGRFGDVSGLWRTIHTGLDFACPTGTPIHAIANGTITFVGWDGSYGNKTVETLADGTEIWYAHQSAFGTQVGATVRQGETIGFVGSTGNTTGPHVHIEVRPGGGDPVDPDPAFKEHGVDPDANQG